MSTITLGNGRQRPPVRCQPCGAADVVDSIDCHAVLAAQRKIVDALHYADEKHGIRVESFRELQSFRVESVEAT
jgi:hypothetical protein